MEYKSRNKPLELKILEYLDRRMSLPQSDRIRLYNLKKGFEGEKRFDSYTKKLQTDCLILNDLLLKVNHTLFQIDSLIISENVLYLYEIKNLDGDYFVEANKFYKMPQSEIINPLYQMGRAESLLRYFLQNHSFSMPIEAKVVFIHPEFTLYQSPLHQPILFHSQLNRYFKNFNQMPSHIGKSQKNLAELFIAQHINNPPQTQLPQYHFTHLKKGMICKRCDSFKISVVRKQCVCSKCGHTCDLEKAVIQCVEELKILFPDKKITTSIVQNWCNVIDSKYIIRKILNANFEKKGKQYSVYYE